MSIAILNEIGLYWLNLWGLLYVTVYQVMFDNFLSILKNENFKASDIGQLNLTDPSELIILVLPSLISVWIALVLSRLKK